VPFRARCLLVLPIDEKVVGIEARVLTGLPLMVPAGGTHQINLVVPLALDQEFCVDIASINDVLSGQELFAIELSMNGCRHGIIRDRSRRGFHMGDKQGQVRFTAFGQMDFVPYPRRAALLAVMSLFVVGRADVARWRRNILRRTPANDILNTVVILHPDLP
jgi:hypothetical protein